MGAGFNLMPSGRPTKYSANANKIAAKVAALGGTDQEIAEILGVNEDTIYEWKNVHPEFSDSIKNAKRGPDELVEASLFKRATGFKRNVQRITKDGDVLDTEEELPPDPVSCIFWLKNRKPKEWRDKQELEHSGELTITVNLAEKTK